VKFYRILIILIVVVVVVFAVLFIVVDMFQGPPPRMVARFNGGDPLSSDVRITDVFHVQEEWSISLSSGIQMLDWSLTVELYEEGGNIPLCSLKGKWGLMEDRVVWERGPGTTAGTFNVPYEYIPDVPSGRYYLEIYWTRITWTIEIYEFVGASKE